jgi:hypothetical protein
MLFLFRHPERDQEKRAPALRLVAPDRRITLSANGISVGG